jgi:MYXO-CTERM domain-containing protein
VQSGPCALSGTTLGATAAGSCVIAADQAGDRTYGAAATVTATVTVFSPPPAGGCSSTNPGWLALVGLAALASPRARGKRFARVDRAVPD